MTIPAVMKAAVTFRHGGPEATEIIPDWPLPPPGPGQAVVRVTAAAVNNTDLWSRAGAYGTAHDPAAVVGWLGVPLTFPLIQGADIAGVVASVGAGVNPSMVGRRVIVDPALAYDGEFPTAVVGSEAHGGFAEYHLTDAIHIHDVDGSPLTDTQLACLPIAYGTAMAMIDRAECRALERVLVTGASGGVGLAAVQILSALGCTVVGYTSADNVEVVESAGAREIIRRGSTTSDHAGRRRGRRCRWRRHIRRGDRPTTQRRPARLAELARAGVLSPLVAATYPLDRLHEAQARFEQKDFVGKLVILP